MKSLIQRIFFPRLWKIAALSNCRASLMADLRTAKAKRQHTLQGQLQRSLINATTDQLRAEVRHG